MIDAQFLSYVAQRRWDIYGPVHKGLRLAHGQFITRLGSADPLVSQQRLLTELRQHLALAAGHLSHEDAVIHPALEAACPGASATLVDDHREHHESFAHLLGLIEVVERSPREARTASWRELYLAFSKLVADDLEHMAYEEAVVWPQLCSAFSDEELAELEMRIIASLAPDETIAWMRIMLPAMAPEERVGLLSGMKAGAPAEAYQAVIDLAARPMLSADDLAHLNRLGLAA